MYLLQSFMLYRPDAGNVKFLYDCVIKLKLYSFRMARKAVAQNETIQYSSESVCASVCVCFRVFAR